MCYIHPVTALSYLDDVDCRYVDGADYMESVADAIMLVTHCLFYQIFDNKFVKNRKRVKTKKNCVFPQAKEEIFITDWWLSPELCLKVNSEANPQKINIEI